VFRYASIGAVTSVGQALNPNDRGGTLSAVSAPEASSRLYKAHRSEHRGLG